MKSVLSVISVLSLLSLAGCEGKNGININSNNNSGTITKTTQGNVTTYWDGTNVVGTVTNEPAGSASTNEVPQ